MSVVTELIMAGVLVGFMVGLTGVGGGSLMTPLLIFVFGQPPSTAVGSDMFFACGTKLVGTAMHHKHNSVNWKVVSLLAAGSIPASVLVLLYLGMTNSSSGKSFFVMALLGTIIFLAGTQMVGWLKFNPRPLQIKEDIGVRKPYLTILFGAILGGLVTLTSIGAGALGVVLLRTLYPKTLRIASLVGTDLAHAIPLTLVAGIGYLSMGAIQFSMVGYLLCGSVPGVIIGSLLANKIKAHIVANILGLLMMVVGIKTFLTALETYV
ncbi:sulfite exporter TauE/SafE family protein [Serratia sp. JSRIV001]|uniref:sulfite exporter TauE/SafE family protein n=1 Tax=unclassified Serratia (in: enterobacteria) TaxID=2647522 RepID=UPI001CBFF92D|nr:MULTISPECIES: sulfite exporter TauE/SafE family protein [unclassified Serratia (in: enterobacteria)]UAN45207.1 sulfite exporter TauE/SafE family protein [Serratia sp. JSRIV001]UAN54519.1 sulfite exporter TauE/SafE family protein [Serratia sp. JSRIV002]UAN60531.1 sulfite exporter TauE/SafE family protein [Serratia sp. JSRIV004]